MPLKDNNPITELTYECAIKEATQIKTKLRFYSVLEPMDVVHELISTGKPLTRSNIFSVYNKDDRAELPNDFNCGVLSKRSHLAFLQTKVCIKCNDDLPIAAFAIIKSLNGKHHVSACCIVCGRAYKMSWKRANPEKIRASSFKARRKEIEGLTDRYIKDLIANTGVIRQDITPEMITKKRIKIQLLRAKSKAQILLERKQRAKEQRAIFAQTHPQEHRAKRAAEARKETARLTDNYIKSRLVRSGIPRSEITAEQIEKRRMTIREKRLKTTNKKKS